MLIKLFNFGLLLLLTGSSCYAEETRLAIYDLKMFDYQIGMSYDEAISARAFHYTTYPAENQAIGIITSAYMDEVEFNTAVYFQDGIVFKIIGRFNPKDHQQVLKSLKKVLGEGEETTKNFTAINGTEIIQSICQWDYPGARINLVRLSNNVEFATLSMMSLNLGNRPPEP